MRQGWHKFLPTSQIPLSTQVCPALDGSLVFKDKVCFLITLFLKYKLDTLSGLQTKYPVFHNGGKSIHTGLKKYRSPMCSLCRFGVWLRITGALTSYVSTCYRCRNSGPSSRTLKFSLSVCYFLLRLLHCVSVEISQFPIATHPSPRVKNGDY